MLQQSGPGGPLVSTSIEEIVLALRAAVRLEDIQRVVRSAPVHIADAAGGTFVLRDGDKCFYADEDAISPLWKGQRFPIGECISGWAMQHGRTAVVPDIARDERIPLAAYRPTFVRSLVMVPIGRPAVAAMGAYWTTPYEPPPWTVAALEEVAEAAADAVGRVGLDGAPVTPVLRSRRAIRIVPKGSW